MRVAIAMVFLNSIALFLTSMASAESGAQPRDVLAEQQVMSASKEWFDALSRGDAQALDRLETEDFVMIQRGSDNVTIIPKADHLNNVRKALESRPKFKREVGQIRIRLYGNVAVLVAITQFVGSDPAGKQLIGRAVITEVWVRDSGRWRLAHLQPTDIPTSSSSKRKPD